MLSGEEKKEMCDMLSINNHMPQTHCLNVTYAAVLSYQVYTL